jgi:pimeloyl-ACP methyl ester carboxylesterase
VTADVVFVHGAWHHASCWDRVVEELARLGIESCAVELPLTGLAGDVAVTREAIEAAGPGCVVVGHSYGGVVISSAAAGAPGVRRLVYVAAFLAEPDEDLFAHLAGGLLVEALTFGADGTMSVRPDLAAAVFYGDADPQTAARLVGDLRPTALGGPPPEGTEPAWLGIPTTYVVCTEDRAIPVDAQRRMAVQAGEVVEWPTDHSPFVTRPAAVAELVATYAR